MVTKQQTNKHHQLLNLNLNLSQNKRHTSSIADERIVQTADNSDCTKEDLVFAKKYNIHFHDFGCIAPTNFKEYETKNQLVFEYLNKTYGKQWQKEIKQSVMGFEKWKKK